MESEDASQFNSAPVANTGLRPRVREGGPLPSRHFLRSVLGLHPSSFAACSALSVAGRLWLCDILLSLNVTKPAMSRDTRAFCGALGLGFRSAGGCYS